MHVVADYSKRKADKSTVSCKHPDKSHEIIATNGIVSVYNEASVLMVLKDPQAVFQ